MPPLSPSPRPKLACLLIVACATVSLSLTATAAATPEYKTVRGIGPAKREGHGLLRVKVGDSKTLVTHGLDPKGASVQAVAAGPERAPVCASDRYQHFLYGYPADRSNRISAVHNGFVSVIRQMNAMLNDAALESGNRAADYKVKCDAAGSVRIDAFRSPTPDAGTSFSTVVDAARLAGFSDPNADYTIFFDSAVPPGCGTASYLDDQQLSAENRNNQGGGYAVAYQGCWDRRTLMHENGHNQGAVQYNAPFSTGSGAHCSDGSDVMCYSDGGDKDVGLSYYCTNKMHFDCRYDTYFDAAPESGEYLESNWNLGSALNRFIAFSDPPPPECGDGIDNDGDGHVDFPRDGGCTAIDDRYEADSPGASSGEALDPRSAPPTITRAAARRIARRRIRQKSRGAAHIRANCRRRTRTSATCRVRWRRASRIRYRGTMVVAYRVRAGKVSWKARARLRRIAPCGGGTRRPCVRTLRWR